MIDIEALLIPFATSEKMYKDRRREWGISKNIKSREMEAIVRKTAQRLQAGKKSYFQLRNTWVSKAKIQRYRRDKKILSEQQAIALRAPTPFELLCYTPLASPLATPRELEIPERLFKVVHEYINGSFDSDSWLVNGSGRCRPKNGLLDDCWLLPRFNQGITNAARLLFNGMLKPAWQALQIAMSLVGELVSAEDPQTVFSLIYTVLTTIICFKLPDIALAVLRQFHNMSTRLVGAMHPLSQTSGFVKELVVSHDIEALLELYQVGIDVFTYRVGELSHDTFQLQLHQIRWSSEFQHELDSIGKLQALLQPFGDIDSAGDAGLEIQLRLAETLRYAGRFHEAFEICERVAKLTLDEENANHSAWYVSEALRLMYACHEKLGDLALAGQCIRQAINIRGAYHNFDDEVVLYLMMEHELLLKSCGALEEAMQVREYHDRLVASEYEKIRQAEEEEWQRFQALDGGEQLQGL